MVKSFVARNSRIVFVIAAFLCAIVIHLTVLHTFKKVLFIQYFSQVRKRACSHFRQLQNATV